MKNILLNTISCSAALVLLGCGSGGGSTPPPTSGEPTPPQNSVPVANAGIDQSVSVGEVVNLSAQESSDQDGDILTYSWNMTSSPSESTIDLPSNTGVTTSLTPDVGGIYTIEVTASDGTATDTDVVEITAQNTVPVNNTSPNPTGDISYKTLNNRNPDCGAYVGSYQANIFDVQENIQYASFLTITADDTSCTFTSNNIPNHDVGGNTSTRNDFASPVAPNVLDYVLTVDRLPTNEITPTYVQKIGGNITLNGILLNGVDLDMDSAFCYNIEFTTPLQIGLGTREQCGLTADWYAVPAANPDYVTLDEFTGHSFQGRYHYHGDNKGLSHFDVSSTPPSEVDPSGSPVIGFAPDGFPIYGHYFYDAQTASLKKVRSSWRTITTERVPPSGSADPAPSIVTHTRGIFVEDWIYEAGSGDLDECNGMTDAYGNYGYYYTEGYPYGPICSFGTPDISFIKPSSEYDNGNVNQ